jgi:hypothetical protein
MSKRKKVRGGRRSGGKGEEMGCEREARTKDKWMGGYCREKRRRQGWM